MGNKKLPTYFTKQYMPYWAGGILLGLLNVVLALVYKPWGITGDAATWGLRFVSKMINRPDLLKAYLDETGYDVLFKHPVLNEETVINIGIVIGVFLAVAWTGQFRVKPIRNRRQIFLGVLGGLLMGYGARLSLGCNVGAVLGGIASQSMHGWVAAVFMLFGSVAGCLLLVFIQKYKARSKREI